MCVSLNCFISGDSLDVGHIETHVHTHTHICGEYAHMHTHTHLLEQGHKQKFLLNDLSKTQDFFPLIDADFDICLGFFFSDRSSTSPVSNYCHQLWMKMESYR